MAVTRDKVSCVIFGAPRNLPTNTLPTYTDLMKRYIQLRQDLKTDNGKYPSFLDISHKLCYEVEEIWEMASLPTVTHAQAIEKLRSFHNKYNTILKVYKGKKDQPNYQRRLSEFRDKANILFDLSKCKCSDMVSKCKCVKEQKVPAKEREFLQDQRGPRKMVIGSIDQEETSKLKRKAEREEANSKRIKKQKTDESTSQVRSAKSDEVDTDSDTDTNNDSVTVEDYIPESLKTTRKLDRECQKMTISLPSLAKACDRTGVSDRSAAVLATSVLHDLGVVSPIDRSKVIDRSKIRRERIKSREKLQQNADQFDHTDIEGIFFDGRKDKTLTQVLDVDNKYHRQTVLEEHISIIAEPGSSYFSHTTPTSGCSKDISESLIASLKEWNVKTDNITVVGCDGTNVNTGHIAGVIRRLEETFGHPLQWLVCLLHANELPLRHLFEALDGATTGPRGFSGSIGKQLLTCTEQPVSSFEPVQLTEQLSNVNPKELSTDQRYLLEMCNSISKGECSIDLARRNPGNLNHSRWLTTANRILRLYVSDENPSDNLKTMVTFIIRVYAPMWFTIKVQSSCKDGARHVHQMIVKSRYLSPKHKKIIDPVIHRNAYFAHPENLLLAMMTDHRPHIRKLGLRRVMKARAVKPSGKIRKFKIPAKLNFDAVEYFDMIDWAVCPISEPPVIKSMTDAELKELIMTEVTPTVSFPKFPCHTQSVERHVKLVTEAAKTVCGQKSRDGFIRARIASRQLMPTFESKRDFSHFTL